MAETNRLTAAQRATLKPRNYDPRRRERELTPATHADLHDLVRGLRDFIQLPLEGRIKALEQGGLVASLVKAIAASDPSVMLQLSQAMMAALPNDARTRLEALEGRVAELERVGARIAPQRN